MRTGYAPVASQEDLLRQLTQLSVKTLVIDIEPLVAYWDSSQNSLDLGIAALLGQLAPIPGLHVVCFATNSARLPSAGPKAAGLEVEYLASARKPLRTAPYSRFPRPGAVIGDQVLTDGVLARRLRYTFLHYRPDLPGAPLGPLLLSRGGDLVRPLLFARPG